MEEERELDLVNDRFDDISIDDQPLDIASEAGSDFDENEMRNQIEEGPRSLDYRKDTRYKRNKQIADQMPTIAEERTVDCRSVLSNHSGQNTCRINAGSSKPADPFSSSFNCGRENFNEFDENSDDFSNQFQPGSVAVGQYEEEFFAEQNRANVLFPEDDLRFRGQNKFEKENSWEPSIVVYESQQTPEIETSPGMLFEKKEIDCSENKENQILDVNQGMFNKSGGPSHNSNILFTSSPMSSSRLVTNAKTSTPKRPGGGRFGHRPQPQLEISTISSIHASSPNRAPQIFASNVNSPCTSTTMMTNNTIGHSTIQNIFSNCKGGDILSALEMARKNKDILKPKIDFRRNATLNKTNSSTRTAVEASIQTHNRDYKRDSSSCRSSISRKVSEENHKPVELCVSNTLESGNTRNSQLCSNASNRYTEREFDGRGSVNSIRTSSRTSTHSTVSLATHSTAQADRCLKIHGKRFAFGVIDVGDTLSLEMLLENVTNRSIQVRSTLDSQTKVFEIKENSLALIEPGASVKLRVSFTPESAGRYQLFLKVEVQGLNKRYTIPVWGCGGLAKIEPIIEGEMVPSNTKDYVMRTSKFTNIVFKLKNSGKRDGFALIDVYDSMMKKVQCHVFPSNALMLRRQREKCIEIRLSDYLPSFADLRSSSSMSSVSSRRSTLSGADLTIQIKWGEEIMRQRLKLLSKQKNIPATIDGHDFIKRQFEGEEELRPTNGFPAIYLDDLNLFEAAYRTTNILVFSIRNARQFDVYRTSSVSSFTDSTVFETTGFRNETFVRDVDATLMPRR